MGLVVFYSPYYHTTSGHKNVSSIVRKAARGHAVLHLHTEDSLLRYASSSSHPSADVLLIDFPDTGHRQTIRRAIDGARFRNASLAFISMYAPLRDTDAARIVPYDCVIGFEPEYSPAVAWTHVPDHVIGPVYSPRFTTEVRPWLSGNPIDAVDDVTRRYLAALQNAILLCETGTPDEQTMLYDYTSRSFPGESVIRSRTLPPVLPVAIAARWARRVVACGGYSMTWELAATIDLDKVHWVQLNRPSEDCTRRIMTAFAMQRLAVEDGDAYPSGEAHPLLERTQDGLLERGIVKLTTIIDELSPTPPDPRVREQVGPMTGDQQNAGVT